MTWLRPLGYEINIDEATVKITKMLDEKIDKDANPFDTYETSKVKLLMQTKVPKLKRKR